MTVPSVDRSGEGKVRTPGQQATPDPARPPTMKVSGAAPTDISARMSHHTTWGMRAQNKLGVQAKGNPPCGPSVGPGVCLPGTRSTHAPSLCPVVGLGRAASTHPWPSQPLARLVLCRWRALTAANPTTSPPLRAPWRGPPWPRGSFPLSYSREEGRTATIPSLPEDVHSPLISRSL